MNTTTNERNALNHFTINNTSINNTFDNSNSTPNFEELDIANKEYNFDDSAIKIIL